MYISPGYCNPMFGNVYDISWSMCDTVCYTYQAAMPVTCLVSDLQSPTSGQSLEMLTVFPIWLNIASLRSVQPCWYIQWDLCCLTLPSTPHLRHNGEISVWWHVHFPDFWGIVSGSGYWACLLNTSHIMYANTMAINRCSADRITIHTPWHLSQSHSCESISAIPLMSLLTLTVVRKPNCPCLSNIYCPTVEECSRCETHG